MSLSIRSALLLVALVSTSARAGDVSVQLDSGAGFSLKNSTGAIERLRVDEATGNVSRNGALFVHTTGPNSTFIGDSAGLTSTGLANTAVGARALYSNTTGYFNTAGGTNALFYNGTGHRNAAFGSSSLQSNTSGSFNAAVGYRALASNATGHGNSAFGARAVNASTTASYLTAVGFNALASNTSGSGNTAIGSFALASNGDGIRNTAAGGDALRGNVSGSGNTAVGSLALRYNDATFNSAFGASALLNNTSGSSNDAFGVSALARNSVGHNNAAFGSGALYYNQGGNNAAFGTNALFYNASGNNNVAVGRRAGFNQTTGSNNIYLQNTGASAESGQIKIGTVGTHTAAHVAGIHSATSAGGIAVLVNASGTLGTSTSSARFKQDVRDMGEASDMLMQLRPVTFRYRKDAVGAAEEAKSTQYGLIAEEVAEVAPELVATDLEGRPYSVKYHELPALLLNEVQEQRRTIARLEARIAQLERSPLDAAATGVGR